MPYKIKRQTVKKLRDNRSFLYAANCTFLYAVNRTFLDAAELRGGIIALLWPPGCSGRKPLSASHWGG